MKKIRYEKPQQVKDLELSLWEMAAAKHSLPKKYIPKPMLRDDTANGLTECIIKYLQAEGWQAERVNTTGRIVNRKRSIIRGGKMVEEYAPMFAPTNCTKGSADISATIFGRSVKIEVKIGADRQSEAQKSYQLAIERAGGVYYIAKDFPTFCGWYSQLAASLQ